MTDWLFVPGDPVTTVDAAPPARRQPAAGIPPPWPAPGLPSEVAEMLAYKAPPRRALHGPRGWEKRILFGSISSETPQRFLESAIISSEVMRHKLGESHPRRVKGRKIRKGLRVPARLSNGDSAAEDEIVRLCYLSRVISFRSFSNELYPRIPLASVTAILRIEALQITFFSVLEYFIDQNSTASL